MKQFEKYLKQFAVPKHSFATFGRLKGGDGLYYIPVKEQKTFWKHYCDAIKDFTNERHIPLVYRPPNIEYVPLHFDIDIRTNHAITLSIEYAMKLFRKLDLKCDALFVAKDAGYWKTYKKTGEKYCSGQHIYIQNSITLEEALTIRKRAVSFISEVYHDIPYTNSEEDVVDTKIPSRSNGLMLMGTFKSRNSGGQYNIKGGFHYKDGEYIEYGQVDLQAGLLETIYSFVFQERPTVVEKKIKTKIVKVIKPKKSNTVIPKEKNGFDLCYYLEVSDLEESHSDWLQLISYCKSNGYDKDFVCDALNSAFKPANLEENAGVWENFTTDNHIGIGSLVRLLKLHANVPFDSDIMFPTDTYKYHNEHTIFSKGEWTLFEIHRFFRDVYNFCFGNASHTFLYKEQYLKKYKDNTISLVRNVVTDVMPFSVDSCDKIIKVLPSRDELYKRCLEIAKKPPKFNKHIPHTIYTEDLKIYTNALSIIQKPAEDYTYKYLRVVLGKAVPRVKEMSLAKMFKAAKQRSIIDREYVNFDIFPYLFVDKSPKDCFNLWSQFELVKYMNDEIDIRKTKIWEWLWRAWANEDEYKMRYYLSYFALKLQFPWLKIKKFLTLFGEKGAGKSSVLYFAQKLYGKDRVKYLDDIASVFDKQNAEMVGVILLVVDDVETMTKSISDKLKSYVTSDYRVIKKLYENPKTLRSYIDIIATSNSSNPTYVDHENRRDELGSINPCLKGDKKFWDAWYEEVNDLKILGAWFSFLAFYPDCLPISSENCRLDLKLLEKSKLRNMKTAHRFVVEFFNNPLCFEMGSFTKNNNYVNDRVEWFRHIYFNKLGSVHITLERTYLYYTCWCKEYKYNAVRLQTFLEHLDLIHLKPSKIKKYLHKKKVGNCFTFGRDKIVTEIAKFYRCKEVLVQRKMDWCINDTVELKRLREYEFGANVKLQVDNKWGGREVSKIRRLSM